MPSVRQLTILIAEDQTITAEDVQLLAEKSLDHLKFLGGVFSTPAMLIAASSKAPFLKIFSYESINGEVRSRGRTPR
jgi:hypothetical protein